MADLATCERCGKPGKRRLGFVAPEGWFFGSFTFDGDGDHAPGDFLIVHACSAECRDALWTQQNGHRWADVERRVNVPDELRRAARVHADRMRAEADKIAETAYPTGEDGSTTAAQLFAKLLRTAAGELVDMVESTIDGINEDERLRTGGTP
jgi:hypothetical protein